MAAAPRIDNVGATVLSWEGAFFGPRSHRVKTILNARSVGSWAAALFWLALTAAPLLAQGPPYQTDDPVPVELHHYEFYVFGAADGTPKEIDSSAPAFEFNWGAMPRVQLHAILPLGIAAPHTGLMAYGLTDMELGAKVAFIQESKHLPQIGTFVMFEIPTGNADKGLGVGKLWYKVPIWFQKNSGKWTFDGGAGYAVNRQAGFRSFPYTGWLVKKECSERLELAMEVFAHGPEGSAAPQTEASTMIDLGGYYHFKHHPGQQFLFAYGHSIAGQTENYAYIGLYWTWGRDKDNQKKGPDESFFPGPGRLKHHSF